MYSHIQKLKETKGKIISTKEEKYVELSCNKFLDKFPFFLTIVS